MKPSNSTSVVNDTLKSFNENFNSNDDKLLTLAYGCQDDIAIIWKFNINGISTISSWKESFSEYVFRLPLVYEK